MKIEKQEEKGLQKYTNDMTVYEIMNSTHRLTLDSISHLSDEKKEEINRLIRYKLSVSTGEELDSFTYKVKEFVDENERNRTWDLNHERIKFAVKTWLLQNEKFPSVIDIAEKTRLSRVTISKHLKDFDLLDYRKEDYQMMRIMFDELIGKVFAKAMQGDLASIKLITDVMTKSERNSRATYKVNNQQNNFYR